MGVVVATVKPHGCTDPQPPRSIWVTKTVFPGSAAGPRRWLLAYWHPARHFANPHRHKGQHMASTWPKGVGLFATLSRAAWVSAADRTPQFALIARIMLTKDETLCVVAAAARGSRQN